MSDADINTIHYSPHCGVDETLDNIDFLVSDNVHCPSKVLLPK
jgi:hypothetical protein